MNIKEAETFLDRIKEEEVDGKEMEKAISFIQSEVEKNINILKQSIHKYQNWLCKDAKERESGDEAGLKDIHKTVSIMKSEQEELYRWNVLRERISREFTEGRIFNKSICFSNIRFLIRESGIKIGQIEKEAQVRLGYTARLEKTGNTSEPSIVFLMTAAKLLNVSLDQLLTVNMSELTPNERYLISFSEKLKKDTLDDKLVWGKENDVDLNYICFDSDESPFKYIKSLDEEDSLDGGTFTTYEMVSNAFGTNTSFNGPSYYLKMKNSWLYVLSLEEADRGEKHEYEKAKEVWMYSVATGPQFLFGTKDGTPVAPQAENLYRIINDRVKHPIVNNDIRYIIDSYMKDDLEDDIELPFV